MSKGEGMLKFIHEHVRGKCWHEWEWQNEDPRGVYRKCLCKKCGIDAYPLSIIPAEFCHFYTFPSNPNYYSDIEYLPFLRWCTKQPWWQHFLYNLTAVILEPILYNTIEFTFDQKKLLPAIAKWHGWKETA